MARERLGWPRQNPPGLMQLARMLYWASQQAISRVMLITPPLAAA